MMGITFLWSLSSIAQSTDDVRFTFGEGPFPLYLTGSAGFTSVKPLFRDFVDDYIEEEGGVYRNKLHTLELNLGTAINCTHCLSIKGFHIRNFAFELGFLKAQRKLTIDSGYKLHLVESVGSARLIYRFTKLYPLTFQLHGGLNYYSFYQIREVIETDSVSSFVRVRAGSSISENHSGKLSMRFPGYNFRFRIALVDPSGVGSGVGIFAEYSYKGKWRNENFNTAYELFELPVDAPGGRRRNLGHWSMGFIVPLAVTLH